MRPAGYLPTSLIIAALHCFALDARAQFACPEASTDAQATRLAGETFAEGERLFGEGTYRAAIERFECSYSLRRHPNTLFNIARAAEELEDWPLARSTYRNLLDRFPESEAVAESEERLRFVETRLDQEVPQDSTTTQEEGPDTEASLVGAPNDEVDGDTPPQTTSAGRMSGPRIGAWATLALGLVTTITGAALYGAAWSVRNEIPRYAEYPSQYEDDRDRGQALEASGWVLMGSGLASLVVSVVLFTVFDGRASASSDAFRRGLALSGPGLMCLSF